MLSKTSLKIFLLYTFFLCNFLSSISEVKAYLPPENQNSPLDGKEELSIDSNHQVSTNPACQNEVTRICRKSPENLPDLDALECILNQKRNEIEEISDSCNHALWVYRKAITEETGFLKLAKNCNDDFKKTGCWTSVEKTQPGFSLVNCLINKKDKVEKPRCQTIITRLEGVIFSDYEMIEKFASNCEDDIITFKCGRNDISSSPLKKLPHSQGRTIECLSDNIQKLKGECAVEILRIAELQVDDFHLDRALYFSCRDDREKFCKRVEAGNGRVYKCLVRHKLEQEMSTDCREQIYRRQKLGWQDYRASGIVSTCRNEIKKYKCRRGVNSSDKNIRLSQILLCLENEFHKGQDINGDCLDEIKQHRKSLMEDYSLTPELLSACTEDKEKFCADKGLHGKTLHCLMAQAQSRRLEERLSDRCVAELENLLKISDVSGDWSVDPVLQQNCQRVVDRSTCSKYPSNRMLNCLMNLLASDSGAEGNIMTDECETTLIQIQFFLARDFPMDSLLYEACANDAKNICGAKEDWADDPKNMDPARGPLVLSCLFRNIANQDPKSIVGPKCSERVKETMRQRALSVKLMPEIEDACMEELTEICSEKTKPGEEIECLQDHLDELDKPCKFVVSNFTEIEMKNPVVDPFIWKHCREIIEDKCSDDKSDDEDMLECLIEIKNEMKNKKCKVSVEHLQILRLKEVRFSPKFKAQCQSDVIRYCNSPDLQPLTSWKVVSCLSNAIRTDIITENTQRVSKGCRKQVRSLLLTKIQFETGSSDAHSLYNVCSIFIKKLCPNVARGGGRFLECLRNNKNMIPETSECHQTLFKVEQETDADTKLDVVLTNECDTEIRYFCPGKQENLLECLQLNSNKEGFKSRCSKIVRDRIIEQNSDARLNIRLYKSCKLDVKKFCEKIPPGQGRIIGCLKNVFLSPKSRLTPTCKTYIEEIMERAAKEDVRYDSDIYSSCKSYIESSCATKQEDSDDKDEPDKGRIEECLKQLFQDNKIQPGTCKDKVANLIQSSMIDIHVDPILSQACAVDLVRHCDGVPPGDGRLLHCLFTELNDEKAKGGKSYHLSERCRELLTKRAELFKLAGDTPGRIESLVDLVEQVQVSPHRNYFLSTAMTIVGLIFIFGLFCGRATKRRAAEKNK